MANSILEKVRVSTEVTFRSVIVEKRACVQSGNRMKSANRYHASDEPSRRTAELCHKIPCDTEAVLAVVNTARSTSVSSQDGGLVDFILWTVSCWGVSILTCFNHFQHLNLHAAIAGFRSSFESWSHKHHDHHDRCKMLQDYSHDQGVNLCQLCSFWSGLNWALQSWCRQM